MEENLNWVAVCRVGLRVLTMSLILGLVAVPLATDAQSTAKSYRVGLVSLGNTDASRPSPWWQPFRDAMRELGYVEGANLVFRVVAPAGAPERLPGLIREVSRLGVDVFVTTSTRETRAVVDAAPTVPVVMTLVPDPVAEGFAKSLARPGGNVTGMTNLVPGLSQKYLELLKEAVPRLTKVAVVARPHNAALAETRLELEAAAVALRLGLVITNVGSPGNIQASAADFDEVLVRAKREGAGGFIAVADPLTYFHRRHLVRASAPLGLPGMYWNRDYVEDGGLMSYSADHLELRRRAATYVDKILKGAKPADLPVEQPTKFELVINLRTAKALGRVIPPSVLARADQLIE